ncbi:MAG: hypothetical protein AAF603_03985, partial [Pseudomonadota bacterium]
GMGGMVSDVDTYGNFHLTGFDYGTARDWARYGLLHLNKGIWEGEQIVSKAFVEASGQPAPVWSKGEYKDVQEHKYYYGATHWLNGRGAFPTLPKDAYFPLGFSENYAFIVPSQDLVIVLLRLTNEKYDEAETNEVVKLLTTGLGISVGK